MNLEKDAERGQRAAKLLADDMLTDARQEVERVIHSAWANSPIRDREGAHELRLMLKALDDVWALLEMAIADGKIAQAEIDKLNEKESPASRGTNRR